MNKFFLLSALLISTSLVMAMNDPFKTKFSHKNVTQFGEILRIKLEKSKLGTSKVTHDNKGFENKGGDHKFSSKFTPLFTGGTY